MQDTYESISSALAGLSVGDDDRLGDVAERLEVAAQRLVGRVVRQAADEDLGEGGVSMMMVVMMVMQPAARQRHHARCRKQRRPASQTHSFSFLSVKL